MERLTWEQCAPWADTVNAVARRYSGRSGSEFDDLVQEGWESVCTYLQEGSPITEESIERWVRSYIRQLERLHKGDTTGPFVYGGNPEKPVISIHIRDCLTELPPELRTVVFLHWFGFTFVEIGERMGIHRTTASIWLADALTKLRRCL